MEETRIAVVAIIVEDSSKAACMNEILHEFADHIIGRMGIPYRAKGVNLISVAVDAPMDTINALTGKLGKVEGISVKTALSKA